MTEKIKTGALSSIEVETPTEKLLKFFDYEDLPEGLRALAIWCYTLAGQMQLSLPDGPEKTAGMRKLLEAKDCFVRAVLQGRDEK